MNPIQFIATICIFFAFAFCRFIHFWQQFFHVYQFLSFPRFKFQRNNSVFNSIIIILISQYQQTMTLLVIYKIMMHVVTIKFHYFFNFPLTIYK